MRRKDNLSMGSCRCQEKTKLGATLELLPRFSELRERCPALNQILIPDKLWPDFEEWHKRPDRVALHKSMLLLAFQRGYLGRITSPIHKFLLRDDCNVIENYLKDIQEHWMFDDDPVRRHKKAKIFNGRLAELQVAEWLESERWLITGLEACGRSHDIEARDAKGRTATFEVKFIGINDEDFLQIVDSISGQPAGGGVSVYDPIDYLLFRAYEAAMQLQKADSDKIALVIIDELAYSIRFEVQLQDQWIDWSNPTFLLQHDFRKFLEHKKSKYPEVFDTSHLRSVVDELNEIWILTRSEKFQFKRKHSYDFREAHEGVPNKVSL